MSAASASRLWATISRIFAEIFSAAWATATPPIDSEREPYVPRPIGPVAVSPWTTSTTLGSAPRRSATICAKPVSWPWPCGEAPVNTVTEPVGCTRTSADSYRPMPRPKPLGPTARDGARPQISVYVEKPMPRRTPCSRSDACSARNASMSTISRARSSATS